MSVKSSTNMRVPSATDKLVFLVLLVCSVAFLQLCGGTSVKTNRGYVFTAPEMLLTGETETCCLSLHNLEPPINVLVELFNDEDEILANASSVVETGIETCLKLAVPPTKSSSGSIRVKIVAPKHNYEVTKDRGVFFQHDSLITFVETDKPIYKAGQDVNIRILSLKHDLKPWKESIPKVWIENPSGVRVTQWTNVSTENGMAQLLFPLSLEPSTGTWKIVVKKNKLYPELSHITTFQVKKYVLPRFQLTVNPPEFILADTKNVTWSICAKYSYGKPVKGTLQLQVTMLRTIDFAGNLPQVHYETEMDLPSGCFDFLLTDSSLGLADFEKSPDTVILIANFTEAGTGVVETVIKQTQVMHVALKLEFEPHTPKYFKPGVPYHGKLRVLHLDNSPAPFENIQLCLKQENVACRIFQSGVDGFIDFVVQPLQKAQMTLVATAPDYPIKYYLPTMRWKVLMDQPSANFDVHSWYSPSNSYLAVARGNQPIVCGEKYSFNVMYTVPAKESVEPISFHYSINSKGDLLIYGHVKPKPGRDTILNFSEFSNLLSAVKSPANKAEASVVHRFPLSVKITPSMAPVSELLLYYVRSDGEVVATTYKIEVGHCFENKVKTAWHSDVRVPGSTTQYHVEAAPWSLCGVSTVDKSTLFLGGSKSNLISANQAFDALKRFHPSPSKSGEKCGPRPSKNPEEEIDHLAVPAYYINLRMMGYLSDYGNYFHYVDATQAFEEFGVLVLSDLAIQTCPLMTPSRPYFAINFREKQDRSATAFPLIRRSNMMASNVGMTETLIQEQGYVDPGHDQTATIRSYFPETWLWELVPTGKEGKVTIERTLPHTITDWVGYTTCISPAHGLGIAPPTTITAFQAFFLDYSLPYSVKRGELLRLKVSLFNYMHHSLPVKITLEDAPGLDLHLSLPSASFCVKQRDSVVHEYILRPRVIGEVNITVSASINAEYTGSCGPETILYTRDVIVKPILILPEGFPVEVTKSAFICPKDFSDDSAIVWDLILPENVIPDSGRAYVNLIGDILGPAVENLDSLVRLPVGCGEQNMVILVPNIHVIKYLDAIKVENSALRARAIKNMKKGYQRELNYRHPDGSYSAFGPSHGSSGSSIWLTAFVLKSFAQAQNLITIDENDLKLSADWILKKQQENGCFPVIGTVFHKQMKGGLQDDDSSVALTAYILISLLESKVPVSRTNVLKALHCIERGTFFNNKYDPYALAVSTYASVLARRENYLLKTKIPWVQTFMNMSTYHNDLLWWEDKAKPSLSLSIEMTAYAILTLVKLGGEENMAHALKAVRWLSKQRNAGGGFISTQDTVLGLEALTKYAAAVNSNNTDLSVLVIAGTVDQVHRMHNDNRMVLTQIHLPVLPSLVEIFAEGEGCVLVQSNMKYNVAHVTGSEAFDLTVRAKSVPYTNECAVQEITICARYNMADEESNMALIEIGMISGYVPTKASLHTLLERPSSSVKRFEEDRGIVTLYFDKLTNENTCVSFTVEREVVVDRLEPANVKLYDYYQQELTISKSYNFAQICSSAEPSDVQPTPEVVPEVVSKNILAVDSAIHQLSFLEVDSNNNMQMEKSAVEYKSDATKPNNKIDETISITGAQSKVDNVPFVENSNPKINDDDLDSAAHVLTTNNNSIINDDLNTPQVESGSGLTSDSEVGTSENGDNPSEAFGKETKDSEFPGNSSFVVINHELETPEGMEGPVPVYVKPDRFDYKTEATIGTNGLSDLTPMPEMGNQNISWEESDDNDDRLNSTTNDELHLSSPTRVKQFCPTCADKLPSDISDAYCSASNAFKVAIRRLRKARLLLDLHASREVRRVHATIEFALPPDCSCAPLDSPGSLALIMSKDDDFLASGNHKQTLSDSFYIYGVPSVSGVPVTVTEARLICSDQEKEQSAHVDPPVGD